MPSTGSGVGTPRVGIEQQRSEDRRSEAAGCDAQRRVRGREEHEVAAMLSTPRKGGQRVYAAEGSMPSTAVQTRRAGPRTRHRSERTCRTRPNRNCGDVVSAKRDWSRRRAEGTSGMAMKDCGIIPGEPGLLPAVHAYGDIGIRVQAMLCSDGFPAVNFTEPRGRSRGLRTPAPLLLAIRATGLARATIGDAAAVPLPATPHAAPWWTGRRPRACRAHEGPGGPPQVAEPHPKETHPSAALQVLWRATRLAPRCGALGRLEV